MNTFLAIQSGLEKFEEAKDKYWNDLESELNHFVPDLIEYFRFPESNLINGGGEQANRYVEIGVKENGDFKCKPPAFFPGNDLALVFTLRLLLGTKEEPGKYAYLFDLEFYKESGVHYIKTDFEPDNLVALNKNYSDHVDFSGFYKALGRQFSKILSTKKFD